MAIATVIKEMLGKCIPIIYSIHCINKEILCSGNNNTNTNEEVLSRLNVYIKINVHHIL
jgi:hypothetical protein